MATDTIVVFVTTSSLDEAKMIGRALVEQKLAACANIVPGLTSIFRWEGKLSEESEVLVILKSRHPLFNRLREVVTSLHSYAVPEVIAMAVVEGAEPYLKWIAGETLSV